MNAHSPYHCSARPWKSGFPDQIAMLAAGVTFEEDPRHEPYGSVAVRRDPFGNRWDLLKRTAPQATA